MKGVDPCVVNPLCDKCLRPCKQMATVLLIECPRFRPMPFKIERLRFDQLPLFATPPTTGGTDD